RTALAQRHAREVAFCRVGRLADSLRHLACLAVAVADPPLLVAYDDERREAEAPTALHHLGDAVDRNEFLGELVVPVVAVAMTFPWFTCHDRNPFPLPVLLRGSELEPALAGGLGQCLDAPVEHVAAAIEHDVLDSLGGGALRHRLADRRGGRDIGTRLERSAHVLLHRGRGGERLAYA